MTTESKTVVDIVPHQLSTSKGNMMFSVEGRTAGLYEKCSKQSDQIFFLAWRTMLMVHVGMSCLRRNLSLLETVSLCLYLYVPTWILLMYRYLLQLYRGSNGSDERYGLNAWSTHMSERPFQIWSQKRGAVLGLFVSIRHYHTIPRDPAWVPFSVT